MNKSATATQAAAIFSSAAAYIRKYGWQEEGMSVHGKPRCSMGALESAYPERKWDKDLASIMYEALYRKLNGVSLTQYNRRVRSGEKVAMLYENVATSLIKQS